MTVAPPDLTKAEPASSSRAGGRPPDWGSRPPSVRWRQVGFAASLFLLALAIPVLAYVGFQSVIDREDGRVISPQTDASATGFEAVVEPTPTLLVAQVDEGDELVGVTVLALNADDRGGSVLFVPVATEVELPSGLAGLPAGYESGGAGTVATGVENLLGVRLDDAVVMSPTRWAELVAPVGPLTVANPDSVETTGAGGGVEVVFPRGEIELPAEEVARYLQSRSPGENDLARLVRHQALWEAWLAALATAGEDAALPGEVDVGVGRFVRALAAGSTELATLPVTEVADSPPEGVPSYRTDPEAVEAMVASLIPLPVSVSPGDRARVRILDGTGAPDLSEQVSRVLVPADAEIIIVGNADRFDYQTSQVVYYDRSRQADAERLRDALGVGEVVFSEDSYDAVDITVVVGSDFRRTVADEDSIAGVGSDSAG